MYTYIIRVFRATEKTLKFRCYAFFQLFKAKGLMYFTDKPCNESHIYSF